MGDDSQALNISFPVRDYDNFEGFGDDDSMDLSMVDDGFHPMLAIPGPKGAEYIYMDDYQGRHMSWGDRFCWLVGGGVLSGAVMGGSYGALRGFRAQAGKPWKLRLNGMVNGCTKFAPKLGNSIAILGLLYSGVETTSGVLREKNDSINTLLGFTLAPIMFWSSAGVLAALMRGVVGAGLGTAFVYARNRDVMGLKDILPADDDYL